MFRVPQLQRDDWREQVERDGFHYHSLTDTGEPASDKFVYWREDYAYQFSADEIDLIEAATNELHRICLNAVAHIVKHDYLLRRFNLNDTAIELIRRSYHNGDESLFGRFDLAYDGTGAPKLLEYNADTPTSLLEASIVQWTWKTQVQPDADQFNSLHEALIDRWRSFKNSKSKSYIGYNVVHFICDFESQEDIGNVEYLMDTAVQAGLKVKLLNVRDVGVRTETNYDEDDLNRSYQEFLDLEDSAISRAFKLYPWEHLVSEEFGQYLVSNYKYAHTKWFEPPWKLLLSNKAILPVLWELYPDHPNLLPASYNEGAACLQGRPYVRKPFLSREGANVKLIGTDHDVETPGAYGGKDYVYQAYAPLFESGGAHAVIGSWVIGDRAHGMGIREDSSPVTQNTSYFVPHYFTVPRTLTAWDRIRNYIINH